MNTLIIYKGKYGATRQYAEWLGLELELPVYTPDSVTLPGLDKYNVIIAGGSVYMGKWQMREWLLQHAYMLYNKKLFLFIVCATPPDDKEKLNEIVRQNIPPHLRNTCTLYFLHGRMVIGRLSWQDKLIVKIGAWLTQDPVKKKEMLTDFDDVKKDNLVHMLKAIRCEQNS